MSQRHDFYTVENGVKSIPGGTQTTQGCRNCPVTRVVIKKEGQSVPLYRFKRPGQDTYVTSYLQCGTLERASKPASTKGDDFRRLRSENGKAIVEKPALCQHSLTEPEAQVKDCIIVIKILYESLRNPELMQRAEGIARRLLESKGLKDWIAQFEKLGT